MTAPSRPRPPRRSWRASRADVPRQPAPGPASTIARNAATPSASSAASPGVAPAASVRSMPRARALPAGIPNVPSAPASLCASRVASASASASSLPSRSAATAASSTATRPSARGRASPHSAAMAASRPSSGGSATALEGTLSERMHRAATPRGQGLGAGTLAPLSAASGLRLDAFRTEHVTDRIERALAAERLATADELVALLRRDGRARERFRRSVAVSHSGFFRDPEQFDVPEHRVWPRVLEHESRVRAWSAGCANGLELWSLAVVLSRLAVLDGAYLLGSDLLEENLAVARAGVYDVVEISPARRGRARWERRDLVHDPPPTGRFDLILCRNVAIYLEPAAKARLHRMLAGALAAGVVLVLGRSERLGDPAALGLRRVESHVYECPR